MRLARWLAAIVCGLGTASGSELGHPAFRDFPPGRSNIGFLTQGVIQDEAGFITIASGPVFRHFDGTIWRLIPTSSESAGARRMVRADDGRIYVGGPSLIGYLQGSGEACTFVSLAGQVPSSELGYDEIADVLAVGAAVYFSDREKILRWRNGAFHVIPCRSPPRTRGPRLHRVGDSVYVAAPGAPLCRLVDDRLEEVADDPVLRANPVVWMEPGHDGGLVVLTAGHGFVQINRGRVAPFPTESNRWLAGKTVWRALRMKDRSLAVIFTSLSGEGGMRFDPEGRYVGPIDQTLGLYLKEFRDLFEDREGGLWLGSEVGLFRLEWPSPISVFDAVNGLGAGTVTDVVRHEGELHAATSEGVFRLHPAEADGRGAHFERVLREPASALLSHRAGLLVLGYTELWQQTENGFTPIATTPAGGGTLLQSPHDPNRVWVCTVHGLQAVRRTAQGWHDEGMQFPLDQTVTAVRPTATGTLHVATAGTPGFQVKFSETTGRPERVTANSSGERATDLFAECAAHSGYPAGEPGARWIARTAGIERVPHVAGAPHSLPAVVGVSAGVVACLHEESGPDGTVLWIGGSRGLVRLDVTKGFPPPVPFAIQLRAKGVKAGEQLGPEHAPLRFDYVALRHQVADAVKYQTRLLGVEEAWSGWTAERTRTFVRLPAGSYHFEVRAQDADGTLSAPAALRFAVMPPWWFTTWAWLGYAAVGAGALWAFSQFRTRALQVRAERLEGVIAQRTAELAQRNAELVRLHQLELDEKISARLAEEKARLEMLRYQLNPHFLFNTLASISASLPNGASTAQSMVERLADFCRLTLHRSDDRDWTTLGDELHLLKSYLAIEQSRWGELLDVSIASDPALQGERLPYFLLLPLVENALKYGRATSPDRVGFRLTVHRETDGALVLAVANTGTWIEPSAKKTVPSLSIGLDNLRERLARHYPRTHDLAFSHANGWVTVTLRLGTRLFPNVEPNPTLPVKTDMPPPPSTRPPA